MLFSVREKNAQCYASIIMIPSASLPVGWILIRQLDSALPPYWCPHCSQEKQYVVYSTPGLRFPKRYCYVALFKTDSFDLARLGSLRAYSSNMTASQSDLSCRDGCFSDAQDEMCSEADTKAAENWLEDIEHKCHTLLDNWESQEKAPKIKIAILDTGISREHQKIKDRLGKSRQIRDYREWREGKLHEPCTDDTAGHGTHCTSLLARIVPEQVALIYVGKIAESTNAVNASNVAEVSIFAETSSVHSC